MLIYRLTIYLNTIISLDDIVVNTFLKISDFIRKLYKYIRLIYKYEVMRQFIAN